MIDIQAWLETGLNCPVAEIAFTVAPDAREYCAWIDSIRTISADGKVVGIVHNLTVELYTKESTSPLLSTFEKMLSDKNVIPERESDYIDDLRTYITAYAFYFYDQKRSV